MNVTRALAPPTAVATAAVRDGVHRSFRRVDAELASLFDGVARRVTRIAETLRTRWPTAQALVHALLNDCKKS
jgi:hypothetical protein